MRGEGWQCDECEAKVIQQTFNSGPSFMQEPPPDWYTLVGPSVADRAVFVERREFCSLTCLAAWSAACGQPSTDPAVTCTIPSPEAPAQ